MDLIHGISACRHTYQNVVLAIGVFDGLHHGHRRLIEKTRERAGTIGGTSMVMTFDPHPVNVLHPDRAVPLIASLPYRLKLLEETGVDVCCLIRFNRRFARLLPEDFIRRYLVDCLQVSEVVVGEDFRFGRNRAGNARSLKEAGQECGFRVHTVKIRRDTDREKQVSSSRIRRLIARGDVCEAARLLDRPVAVMGQVISGDRRGRRLGYPTANLDTRMTGAVPNGVFCVRIHVGRGTYYGIANVGRRPSFKKDQAPAVEVHIFDLRRDLYGKTVIVEFLKKIRDEQKFSSSDQLVERLRQDEQYARGWFLRHSQT
ncbi:MAG: bifunctional riboflavin kinase/FAD synthetase [Candidatus Omnitrophota bacterium]